MAAGSRKEAEKLTLFVCLATIHLQRYESSDRVTNRFKSSQLRVRTRDRLCQGRLQAALVMRGARSHLVISTRRLSCRAPAQNRKRSTDRQGAAWKRFALSIVLAISTATDPAISGNARNTEWETYPSRGPAMKQLSAGQALLIPQETTKCPQSPNTYLAMT